MLKPYNVMTINNKNTDIFKCYPMNIQAKFALNGSVTFEKKNF